MSHHQQRQFNMVGGNYNYHHHQSMNDTTYTKIFVGGLAWETQRDTMRKYFEQFGEILEAVVITDKTTGRSKGYGFVTFKDPESAFRACQNPSPMIDGRRANCNLASLGAQKNRPPTPQHVGGGGRFRGASPLMNAAAAYTGSSSSTPYFPQHSAQPPFYSPYGFTGFPQDTIYHMNMNYYNPAYSQQFSPYYPTSGAGAGGAAASGSIGYFPNYYHPYYPSYAQSNQGHGFGVQIPHQMVQQYPFLPQHSNSSGILSLPTSTMVVPAPSTTSTTTIATSGVTAAVAAGSGPSQVNTSGGSGSTSEQNSST